MPSVSFMIGAFDDIVLMSHNVEIMAKNTQEIDPVFA